MALAELPLATSEFLAVDVETNGAPGEDCELTEVGAVLVGGGELHERFESLVRVTRPLPQPTTSIATSNTARASARRLVSSLVVLISIPVTRRSRGR